MRKYNAAVLAAVLMFLLSSCAGIIGFRNPQHAKGEAPGRKPPLEKPALFEDFESGRVEASYSYANEAGAASASAFTATTEDAHSGDFAAKAAFDTGISSEWGCGIGLGRNGGPLEADGGREFSAWIKAPEGVTFYFFVNEANINEADGEYWNSPDQTGRGEWSLYEVPFDEFSRNIYSGNQAGNLEFNASGIGTIGVQFGGAQGRGTIFVDDIYIK